MLRYLKFLKTRGGRALGNSPQFKLIMTQVRLMWLNREVIPAPGQLLWKSPCLNNTNSNKFSAQKRRQNYPILSIFPPRLRGSWTFSCTFSLQCL